VNAPRIYLAGPDLFYRDAAARYARLKVLCARHGLLGVAPTDGQEALQIEPTPECARRIYRHDIETLRNCVAVLANLNPFHGPMEPDSGTAYEVGYAAARGLLVVSYCEDGRTVRDRTLHAGHLIGADGRDDDGLLVEDFGLPGNLMLCAEHPFFQTPEEGAAYLAAHLAKEG
jgi:nucleoside 2-deoxyribosyltransferase